MLKYIKRFVKSNKYELAVSFFVFTNLFPKWFPQFFYYITFLMLLTKMSKFKLTTYNMTTLFYVFIGYLWLSTTIGMVLDLRLVIFSFVLYISAPRSTVSWHLYKIKLLYCLFLGFGLATLANFYAKLAGVNQIVQDDYSISVGRVVEFSGFANYAMWTSCAAALSTLFFVSMAFRGTLKGKTQRYICFFMIVVSLYVTIISASRSSFLLSLVCSLLIIWMQSKRFAVVRNLFIIGIVAVVCAPFLMKNAQAMMHKKNGLKITVVNTSRDELWSQRMEEFQSSPILGIGFAAHGVGNNKQVGRNESGGSFISVLAQAGIIGIVFVLIIWINATALPHGIGRNPDLILIYASFVFMSVHSIIEGYMFQAGWYLCLIIWLVVGVMIEHKTLRKKYPQLMT